MSVVWLSKVILNLLNNLRLTNVKRSNDLFRLQNFFLASTAKSIFRSWDNCNQLYVLDRKAH